MSKILNCVVFSILIIGCVERENSWLPKLAVGQTVALNNIFQKDIQKVFVFKENEKISNIKKVFPNLDLKQIDSFGIVIVLTSKVEDVIMIRYINTYSNITVAIDQKLIGTFTDINHIYLRMQQVNEYRIFYNPN